MQRGSKVLFKHSTFDNLQVGIVVRFRHFPKLNQTLYTVVSERGEIFVRVPILPVGHIGRKPSKYIHEEYTNKFTPRIETNLRLDTQANYYNPSYRPEKLRA